MKKFNKIYVEITNYCNLNCSFCSKDKRNKREMNVLEFNEVVNKIKDYTKTIYLHLKGEPLLHSKLDEILAICDKNNINVKITTNGTLLKSKLNILKKHHIKQINISLHSENNYPNYFEDVFNSCDELSKNTTIVYRIWVLSNLCLDKISTMIVEKITNHYKLSTILVDKIKFDKNVKIMDNIYLDKDNEFIWPNEGIDIDDDKGYCLGTKSHIGILSDGTVVPCCLDSDGIINLGNIFESDLNTIINSDKFKLINEGFSNNKVICDLCKKCNYLKIFKKMHNKCAK